MDSKNNTLLIQYFYLISIPALLFGYLAIISILAPILEEYEYYAFSNYFYGVLSNICHQYPSRCLWIMMRPMGLCSRCFSIYMSFSLSLVLFPLIKEKKLLLLISLLSLPLILDGVFQYYVAVTSNLNRLFTGVLFGLASSAIYKHFVFYSVYRLFNRKRIRCIENEATFIAPVIGMLLVLAVNLYGMAACFL